MLMGRFWWVGVAAFILSGCAADGSPGAEDASLDVRPAGDAMEASTMDAVAPRNECVSDEDCAEGERCEELVDGEFTGFVCVCDPSPELCDGRDNDCDPSTPDGADDDALGELCDGADDDLCADGSIECVRGTLLCNDDAERAVDMCDGMDNDCNPETPDGAGEPTLGDPCDGDDTDLCADGAVVCRAGMLGCDDDAASAEELCDGVDNDCDPATPDGAGEPTLSDACDGPDTDSCEEGVIVCLAAALDCSDRTGDTAELCDGIDNDCDPATADGADDSRVGVMCSTGMCMGSQVCTAGEIRCGAASGGSEICGNGVDDDCDGAIDESDMSRPSCGATAAPSRTCAAADLAAPPAGTTLTFASTGTDQMFTVPGGVTSVHVSLWGAGGGGGRDDGATGGAGAFATGTLAVTPGESLTVIVGGGGSTSRTGAYGGGGAPSAFAHGGGGRSAVRRAATEIITAAGGGGGGDCTGSVGCGAGGAGGVNLGERGTDSRRTDTTYGEGGSGGTNTCGGRGGVSTCGGCRGHGTGGGPFQGGSTRYSASTFGGAGGGGGYHGGGSAAGDCGGHSGGGGGGGSSFAVAATGCALAGSGTMPPNRTDPVYVDGVAVGATGRMTGGAGRVVFRY